MCLIFKRIQQGRFTKVQKCEQLIEGPEVDVIFLRPFMEPSSMEISEDRVDVVQNQEEEEEEGEDLQEA